MAAAHQLPQTPAPSEGESPLQETLEGFRRSSQETLEGCPEGFSQPNPLRQRAAHMRTQDSELEQAKSLEKQRSATKPSPSPSCPTKPLSSSSSTTPVQKKLGRPPGSKALPAPPVQVWPIKPCQSYTSILSSPLLSSVVSCPLLSSPGKGKGLLFSSG